MKKSEILPNTLCRVICIKPGLIGLTAPSFKYHVVFKRVNQEMLIKYELLQDSMHADNGLILNNSLRVMDRQVREELGLNNEIEYSLSLEQVEKIIIMGTLGELEDLLTYGPEGYRRLAASLAVEHEFDSQAKLELIEKFSGINVRFQIREGIGKDDAKDKLKEEPKTKRTYNIVKEDLLENVPEDDSEEEEEE